MPPAMAGETTMVVNGEKIFFSSATLFEKMGGVNLDGGGILKKSLARSPFRYARPVLGHPPLPCRGGGWGPPENSGTEYLYYYRQQPGVIGTA